MSRIKEVLNKKDNIISIYFTAGFPELNDTLKIIEQLDSMKKNGPIFQKKKDTSTTHTCIQMLAHKYTIGVMQHNGKTY